MLCRCVWRAKLDGYAALHLPPARQDIALKVVPLPTAETATARQVHAWLMSDAQLAAMFQHPYVVPVLGSVPHPHAMPKQLCVAMELAPTTLDAHMQRWRAAQQVAEQEARARFVQQQQRHLDALNIRDTAMQPSAPLSVFDEHHPGGWLSGGAGGGSVTASASQYFGDGPHQSAFSRYAENLSRAHNWQATWDSSDGDVEDPLASFWRKALQASREATFGAAAARTQSTTAAAVATAVSATAASDQDAAQYFTWARALRAAPDLAHTLDLAMDVAQGLCALHRRGPVLGAARACHGGLNPSNVLLYPRAGPCGTTIAKLTPLQLSRRLLFTDGTDALAEVGAIKYLAPELRAAQSDRAAHCLQSCDAEGVPRRLPSASRRDKECGVCGRLKVNLQQADVFSFGVLLGYMVSGVEPASFVHDARSGRVARAALERGEQVMV